MSITQTFYDNLASQYDKLFLDWQDTTQEQAVILDKIFVSNDLASAIRSIVNQIKSGGIFVASIRDYDALLMDKPPYSPPYIHKTAKGQRVSFQTWSWEGDNYRLIQYIVDDEDALQVSKF